MKTLNYFSGVWKAPVLRSVVATVAAISLLVSGCVSMQNVPLPEGGQPSQTMAVKAGDKVEVETRGGKTLFFTVTAVEAGELVGKIEPTNAKVRVRYQDIANLRIQHVDVARTVRAGLEAVGVVLLVAALLVVNFLTLGCFRSGA